MTLHGSLLICVIGGIQPPVNIEGTAPWPIIELVGTIGGI